MPSSVTATLQSNSASCQIANGNCVTDGPGYYRRNERCTITALAAGTLSYSDFAVESSGNCRYDWFQIGSQKYCGTTGPVNVAVSQGQTFTWHTNNGANYLGYTICLTLPPSGVSARLATPPY